MSDQTRDSSLVNLMVVAYDISRDPQSDERYLDVQADARDRLVDGQTHLSMQPVKAPDGSTRYNVARPYGLPAFEAIKQAAGENVRPILSDYGDEIGAIYGVKSRMFARNDGGFGISIAELQPADYDLPAEPLQSQREIMAQRKAESRRLSSQAGLASIRHGAGLSRPDPLQQMASAARQYGTAVQPGQGSSREPLQRTSPSQSHSARPTYEPSIPISQIENESGSEYGV